MSDSIGSSLWIIQYQCQRCGKPCEVRLKRPGFPPQYCTECAKIAASERVKRWRAAHPDKAKAAAKRSNDKRAKKTPVVRPASTPQPMAISSGDNLKPEQALTPDELYRLEVFTFEAPHGVLHWPQNSAARKHDKPVLDSLTRRGFITLLEKNGKGRSYQITEAGKRVGSNTAVTTPQSAQQYTVNGYPASTYQAAILSWSESGTGDLLVVAAAGSAKSTTLVEALCLAPGRPQDKLALAFNKHIEIELKGRLEGTWIATQTIHSVGFQVLSRHLGSDLGKVSSRKYGDLARSWIEGNLRKRYPYREPRDIQGFYSWRDSLKELCDFARLTLTDTTSTSALTALAERFGLLKKEEDSWLLAGVSAVLIQGQALAHDDNIYDFTDMLWLPYTWNLQLPQMLFIAVDEAQDLNVLQRELVLRLRAPGGRILWVGDPDQAIMGFAGADVQSFHEIGQKTQARQMPLSISYRCPLSHIRLAQQIVKTIEPRPNAPEGKVDTITPDQLIDLARPTDMIICRRTAPLIRMALKFIADGRQARVRGQDNFGKSLSTLVATVERTTKCTFSNFPSGVKRYQAIEEGRLEGRENAEAQLEILRDKCQSLIAIYDKTKAHTMQGLIAEVDRLFEDARNAIVLSTVHRAKGLEANRVFVLEPEAMPLTWKKQRDWEFQQEMHIKYVALTRSKQDMYFVPLPKEKKTE